MELSCRLTVVRVEALGGGSEPGEGEERRCAGGTRSVPSSSESLREDARRRRRWAADSGASVAYLDTVSDTGWNGISSPLESTSVRPLSPWGLSS